MEGMIDHVDTYKCSIHVRCGVWNVEAWKEFKIQDPYWDENHNYSPKSFQSWTLLDR
jgi:hypothetical protein